MFKNIKYSNVRFGYLENEIILDDISLEFKEGESIAILGQSGTGKSTILNLIPRIYDADSGEILIDNQKVQNLNLKSLRKEISIVDQNTTLFAVFRLFV